MVAQKNRPVKTTVVSLELLETIKELDGAKISELTERTGLARSTVHNHLQTLMDARYVVKEANTYHVSLKLFHLGEYVRTRKEEYEFVQMVVEELAAQTGMEAGFNVEEHGRTTNVFDNIGTSGISGFDVGSRHYMHCTAAGKAILAELPERRRDEILDAHGLPKQTENTITDREELLDCLETVRERGYAFNDEEGTSGYTSIGKAATYPDGRVLGALAVGGPTYILDDGITQSMKDGLLESVDEIESHLASVLLEQ